MTTNQLTYMQIQEQMRANRANEEIRQQQVDIEQSESIPKIAQLEASARAINEKLPLELRLTEEQIGKVAADAQESLARAEKAGVETTEKLKSLGDVSYQDRLPAFQTPWADMSAGQRTEAVFSALAQAFDWIAYPFRGAKDSSAAGGLQFIGKLAGG
jgi:membrane protein involved in colicin uptake